MTAYKDATLAIVERMQANWSTTDIVLDNRNYVPVDSETAFVHLHVHWNASRQASFGDSVNLYRHGGEVMIEVITPANNGEGLGLEYADTIMAIFRGASFSNVECLSPYIAGRTAGQDKTLGNFWNTLIVIPFYYDKRF